MYGRGKDVATTSLVVTAALGISLAICLANRKRIFAKLNRYTWLRTKDLMRNKQITIINTREECSKAVNKLISDCREHRYLGFDCEWLPKREKGPKHHPVALLQLASPKGTCALFRLCKIGFVPEEIKALLRDPSILKVGVGSVDDSRVLLRDYKALVQGCVDLRFLYLAHEGPKQPKPGQAAPSDVQISQPASDQTNKSAPSIDESSQSEVKPSRSVYNMKKSQVVYVQPASGGSGLAHMAKEILGIELDKKKKIRCSNWEAKELSERQVQYAANDVLVSVLLFSHLTDLSTSLWPPWELKKSQPSWQQVWQRCSPVLDVRPKTRTVGGSRQRCSVATSRPLKPILSRSFCTRKTPLYDNCFLQAPDGEVLCTCDRKKAEWYVGKGLASVVEKTDESLVVRLVFEPASRGGEEREYYRTLKENKCVVCGVAESHVRKSIVPHEYRKHFPWEWKSHQSHDVLLLCVECNQRANASEITLRLSLAEQCNAPISSHNHTRTFLVHDLLKVRSAARAILKSSDNIPASRLQELRMVVAEYFNVEHAELTVQMLHEARDLEASVENSSYEPHGRRVVQHYVSLYEDKNSGLFALERIWRQHFLDVMRPQFLPSLWSTDYKRC